MVSAAQNHDEINLIQYMQNKMLYPQALIFLICFLIACTDHKTDGKNNNTLAQTRDPILAASQMNASKTIAENIMTDSSHSILVKALQSTEMIETLTKPGPFTLFAPTNEAFEKLPPGTFDGLMNNRKDDLANILSFHIVAGSIKTRDLEDGEKLKTLAGEELIVTKRKDKLLINGINIIVPDVQSSNGIVYVIDGLLFPKNQNPASY